MVESEPPWSYRDLARSAVPQAHDILDVATGGGEVFASLAPFPRGATAVEGYVPNLAVARRRLAPLGVKVFQANPRSGMPFVDRAFDLVLNRHGGFRAAEMHRILKPGGVFLTQQVGGDNLADLTAAFGARLPYPGNTLARALEDFTTLGCEIEQSEEWRGPVTFLDVGALVYFLKAVPWVIADFDVERCRDILVSLHDQLQAGRSLQFTYSRFLIQAKRVR
ncbi:class I SAM-dependent methyltransferase [Phenylobacterium sp.]|uniref:class I SAM-dependent methyltransferase n=1 Tax=Phenylobacterium sp. TaxID=1871053 RepID=UPI002896C6A4|nr:class I SAM-dependent methyltransferase [Phenylobacterium sp.]